MAIEKQTYENAMAGYRSALRRKETEWADANDSGDLAQATEASMEAARIEAEMVAFHRRAERHVQSLQPAPPPGSTSTVFRMNDKDAEAAAERLTDEQREHAAISGISEKEYARNRAKLDWMYSTGVKSRGF